MKYAASAWPCWRIILWLTCAFAAIQTIADFTIRPSLLDDALALDGPLFWEGEIWRVFTYALLHGSPGDILLRAMHLGFNMMALVFFGREIERIMGPRWFLAVYIAGAVAGGLTHVLLGPSHAWIVGASGAVCALIFAFTTLRPDQNLTVLLFLVIPWKLQARHLAWFFAGLSLVCIVFGLWPEMGHVAHLGGCAAGAGLAWWWGKGRGLFDALRYSPAAINAVIAKVERHGIHSLTRRERRLLEQNARPATRR